MYVCFRTSNIQNIPHKSNSYSFDYQKNSYFILEYVAGVQEGNIRKTMAARGLVNGRGPRSGRDLVFRCYHPELLIGYLLFSFLEVFDLGEDFIGLSDDLAVYAEADDTSDDTSDCGKYQDHNTA